MKKSISKIIEQTYEFRTKNFIIRAKVKPDDMTITEQMTRTYFIDVMTNDNPNNSVYRPVIEKWLFTQEQAIDKIFKFVEENYNLLVYYN